MRERADHEVGRVRVVRGGKRLLNTRHHLVAEQLTGHAWRRPWEAARWFLQADGESGKQFVNETICVTGDGMVSIKLPVALAHLANAPHGRYVLASTVVFHHRREQWADRPWRTGPWPTASTTTQAAPARTSPLPGRSRRSRASPCPKPAQAA